jgi:hypothetical protein
MKLCVLISAVFVLTAAGLGAWSEPVTVADSVDGWGGGPVLLACGGDSVWAVWVKRGYWTSPVLARCFAADSWLGTEQVTAESCTCYWPSAIRDDSGRPFLAFYDGSYPIDSPTLHDSWAIYTTTRTTGGWTPQQLAQPMMMEAFPDGIRFGRARDSSIGMVWGESFGGVGSEDSVMFSRLTLEGWTPRKCLAPGWYMDTCCYDASLIPGDSTDFYVAFSRWQYPGLCSVHVCTLNESLVAGSATFAGSTPRLARSAAKRYLTFTRSDTLLGSVNSGSGWDTPYVIATGVSPGDVSLTSDAFGWVWACWADSLGRAVLASYSTGSCWSAPETVAVESTCFSPNIVSDEYGVVQCVWLNRPAGPAGTNAIRHARRIGRPAVAELPAPYASLPLPNATVVRGALFLGAGRNPIPPGELGLCPKPALLDVSGRKVLDLRPGANDVRHLSAGVYFVRSLAGSDKTNVKVLLLN